MKQKSFIVIGLLAVLIGGTLILHGSEVAISDYLPPVVSTEWLAEHIDEPDLIVLHMGPKGSYEENHIPGARSASLRKLNRKNEKGIRDEMLLPDDIAAVLSELGITNKSRIVVYFSVEAAAWAIARYVLILEHVGMTGQVAYLDGGLPKWVAEKRPVTTDVSTFDKSNMKVTIDSNILVDIDWAVMRYNKKGVAFIDGRPNEGYTGLSGHWDRLGHIPGAGNVPFTTLLTEEPAYLLKSKEELTMMFIEAGANPGDTVVVYCGTGLWASLPYLAAKHAGYETRLYDGSFQEWSLAENLPVKSTAKASDSED